MATGAGVGVGSEALGGTGVIAGLWVVVGMGGVVVVRVGAGAMVGWWGTTTTTAASARRSGPSGRAGGEGEFAAAFGKRGGWEGDEFAALVGAGSDEFSGAVEDDDFGAGFGAAGDDGGALWADADDVEGGGYAGVRRWGGGRGRGGPGQEG